ncbi:hypothetical protein [Methylobacterium sp. Leaf456]|nr:hypothetical protein [Methylobacterium sp. Leaf456]
MSDHGFAALDIGLAFGVILGIAVWQLVRVKRSIRRDREKAQKPPGP